VPQFIQQTIEGSIATIRLNRPDVHNAFNEVMIAELTQAFADVGTRSDLRAVILAAQGKSFCAGADLGWMQKMVRYSREENIADAGALAAMLRTVRDCPKPTIARVHGAVYGGGLGLVAACDLAVATSNVKFCLSEVKLGIAPAVIAPFLLARMSPGAVRQFALTAEIFDANQAARLGLINDVVADNADLDAWVVARVAALNTAGPAALAACKALLTQIDGLNRREAERITIETIADLRASAEGQQGLTAFLEKRKPGWLM
jgi:methylglutaconyl-CoA hydratase